MPRAHAPLLPSAQRLGLQPRVVPGVSRARFNATQGPVRSFDRSVVQISNVQRGLASRSSKMCARHEGDLIEQRPRERHRLGSRSTLSWTQDSRSRVAGIAEPETEPVTEPDDTKAHLLYTTSLPGEKKITRVHNGPSPRTAQKHGPNGLRTPDASHRRHSERRTGGRAQERVAAGRATSFSLVSGQTTLAFRALECVRRHGRVGEQKQGRRREKTTQKTAKDSSRGLPRPSLFLVLVSPNAA